MAQYHTLCGLVFGSGIKEDIDIAMSFDKTQKNTKTSAQENEANETQEQVYVSELEEQAIEYLKKRKN